MLEGEFPYCLKTALLIPASKQGDGFKRLLQADNIVNSVV